MNSIISEIQQSDIVISIKKGKVNSFKLLKNRYGVREDGEDFQQLLEIILNYLDPVDRAILISAISKMDNLKVFK